MAYVSDSNLTQFWGLAKDYINAEDCRFANWQKTEKAGAVTCWPVGGTELKPTVDFMFSETPPASGDKAPDNPSTITGVSSVKVTRCGKNIITPFTAQTITTNGITFTADLAAGTITADGTATANAFFAWGGGQTNLPKDVTITLSGCPSGGSNSTYYLRFGDGTEEYGNGNTFTIGNKNQYFAIKIFSGVTVSNLVFRPQLELGSTATAFEPYDGADYTINLGGTYYGGSIDLATGLMTVTHESLTITGEENWVFDVTSGANTSYRLSPSLPRSMSATTNGNRFCTHFSFSAQNTMNTFWSWGTSARFGFMVLTEEYPTVESFKTFLAQQYANGTPVIWVYKIETPYTIQLTPTEILSLAQPDKYIPRLNTVYTDASSVQVGYAKSPIRSEYELTQAIIATEGGE